MDVQISGGPFCQRAAIYRARFGSVPLERIVVREEALNGILRRAPASGSQLELAPPSGDWQATKFVFPDALRAHFKR